MTKFISNITEVTHATSLVRHFKCTFEARNFNCFSSKYFGIVVPENIKSSVLKRQAEFVAGRYCAKQCLYSLDIRELEVLIGSKREPIWPLNLIGSITHTDDIAECIVSSCPQINCIGIDTEILMDYGKAKKIQHFIINDSEHLLFRKNKLNGITFEYFLTSVFSAKEAIFKGIYPHIETYIDFLDIEVIEFTQKSMKFRFLRNFLAKNLTENIYNLTYTITSQHVNTLFIGFYKF